MNSQASKLLKRIQVCLDGNFNNIVNKRQDISDLIEQFVDSLSCHELKTIIRGNPKYLHLPEKVTFKKLHQDFLEFLLDDSSIINKLQIHSLFARSSDDDKDQIQHESSNQIPWYSRVITGVKKNRLTVFLGSLIGVIVFGAFKLLIPQDDCNWVCNFIDGGLAFSSLIMIIDLIAMGCCQSEK